MFYKWQNVILPDQVSKETFDEPDHVKVISFETFTDFDECKKAGREQDYTLPHSYDGPYLCILSSKDKQSLEIIYANNSQNDKIDASDIEVHEEQIDPLPDGKCRQKLEDKWYRVLDQEDKEFDIPSNINYLEGWELKKVHKYYGNNIRSDGLAWSQELSNRTRLMISYSDRSGHPKLYLYGKRSHSVFSLYPTELFKLFMMFDSIKAKMYESLDWKSEAMLKGDQQKAKQCKHGKCMHEM